MFSVDEKTVVELWDLREYLAAIDPAEAIVLSLALKGELSRRTPDLTRILLHVANSTGKHGLALSQTLMATYCRALCARLGSLYPGAVIEVWVPPWAMAQMSFGDGSKHTQGVPSNAVEMEPSAPLGLATR